MSSKGKSRDGDRQDEDSILSKVATVYRFALRTNPILVRSVTNGALASLGNIVSQCITPHSSTGKIVWRNVAAFGAFNALISGPFNYYAQHLTNAVIPRSASNAIFKRLALDRLVVYPPYLLAFFFVVALLEGSSVEEAKRRVQLMYWITLKANLQFFTVAQLINIKFVPQKNALLYGNLLVLLWNIYLATRR